MTTENSSLTRTDSPISLNEMHHADRSKTPHKSVAVHASLNEARTTGEGSEPSNQGECPADSPVLFSLLTFFNLGGAAQTVQFCMGRQRAASLFLLQIMH